MYSFFLPETQIYKPKFSSSHLEQMTPEKSQENEPDILETLDYLLQNF
jgi:hypothetical protein